MKKFKEILFLIKNNFIKIKLFFYNIINPYIRLIKNLILKIKLFIFNIMYPYIYLYKKSQEKFYSLLFNKIRKNYSLEGYFRIKQTKILSFYVLKFFKYFFISFFGYCVTIYIMIYCLDLYIRFNYIPFSILYFFYFYFLEPYILVLKFFVIIFITFMILDFIKKKLEFFVFIFRFYFYFLTYSIHIFFKELKLKINNLRCFLYNFSVKHRTFINWVLILINISFYIYFIYCLSVSDNPRPHINDDIETYFDDKIREFFGVKKRN